jgi:hypothetical protein
MIKPTLTALLQINRPVIMAPMFLVSNMRHKDHLAVLCEYQVDFTIAFLGLPEENMGGYFSE